MKQNQKKLLCACLSLVLVCTLAACRTDGGETTAPAPSEQGQTSIETVPTASIPDVVEVEEWTEPEQTQPMTTEPIRESDEEPAADGDSASAEENTTVPTETTEPKTDGEYEVGSTEPQAGALSYAEYLAMSPADQQAYYESFPTLEEFIAWHNAAQAEYEEEHDIPVVTGPIDIGDYMGS